MALVLLMEIHESTFGRMLLAYRKTLFILMVSLNVLVLPVVYRQFLHLLVVSTYFCESGCPGHHDLTTFHTDRLWDGEQCGAIEGGCCRAPSLPWFHKTLSTPTSDYIELRVCCNQGTSDEDVPVGLYEIYVK